jgi:hypothetical protein
MISFRAVIPKDYPALQEMHREQNLPYPLPPLAHPSIVVKLLAEQCGTIVFAAFLRVTSEAYLLASPEGSPEDRWDVLQRGNKWLLRMAWDAGFSDIHAFLPPEVEKPFSRRLIQLGWNKTIWPCYEIWPGNKK